MTRNILIRRIIIALAAFTSLPSMAYVTFFTNTYYPDYDYDPYYYTTNYYVPAVSSYVYPSTQVVYPTTTTTRSTYYYYGSGGYYPNYYPQSYNLGASNCYRGWNGLVCY